MRTKEPNPLSLDQSIIHIKNKNPATVEELVKGDVLPVYWATDTRTPDIVGDTRQH